MFGKKKQIPQIDKEQLELIQNAQSRIKQKKRLYVHFVIFLIGAVFIIIANTVLGIGTDITFFGKEWFFFVIVIWLFLFVYHLFNVFITHKFMGKAWEQQQLDKLVALQKTKINTLKTELIKEAPHIAESEVYNEKLNAKNSALTLIVAVGENDAIGKDNDLIWHLSDDLKRFKSLTNGHHIIMGRKTFESFPKPLPNRTHVVISRQVDYQVPDGVIVVNSLEEAIDISKTDSQPFVIGGGEIYKQAMSHVGKIELTRVHESFDADTFFSKIDESLWKVTNKTFHDKDEKHAHAFSFMTYERI
ncbi:dihydrofolate reductase [Flavobacteriales bacterium 34_180_T64]|nr:dihydrofolate reductase [Flavobacteriales bacterium 34_180_T64]